MSDTISDLIRQRDEALKLADTYRRRAEVWERTARREAQGRADLASAVQYELDLTIGQAERLLARLAKSGAWSGALEREFPELRRVMREARDIARIRRLGRIEPASRRGGQVYYVLLDTYEREPVVARVAGGES